MKKVYIFIYSFFPYRTGGREIWLLDMATRLSVHGYKFCFVTLKPPTGAHLLIDIPKNENLKVLPIPNMLGVLHGHGALRKMTNYRILNSVILMDYIVSARLACDMIKKDCPGNAILIAPNLGFECIPGMLLKKDQSSIKTVTLAMGEWLKDISISYPFAVKYLEKLEKKASNNSDLIIYSTKTQYENEKTRLNLNNNKVRVFPLGGFDEAIFHPPNEKERMDARDELGIKADDFAIINTGLLRKVKGQEVLINALNGCRAKKRIVLNLIGRGDEQYIKKIVKTADDDVRIHFLGWKNREDIVKFLWASDVFVLPSLTEALSISLIESMATGLPAIASDVGGIREVLEDGGILVPPGDVRGLATALGRMYENIEQYRILAKRNIGRIRRDYSMTKSIERFKQILDEI